MKRKLQNTIISALLCFLFFGMSYSLKAQSEDFTRAVQLALRETGHLLLLENKDKTSLVLPIKRIDDYKYELAFNTHLAVEPNLLVKTIEASFLKVGLPDNYQVAVFQCDSDIIAYSYEMKDSEELSIIPCSGRQLPKACYGIEVHFVEPFVTSTNSDSKESSYAKWFFLGIGALMVLLLWYIKRKPNKELAEEEQEGVIRIGSFQFIPDQLTLIQEAIAIKLSKKECELLSLFIEKPNQTITREELTKKVWEDNGVFVGRSLDTYISKLRKILKSDTQIKITNVHGVGYKLEISENIK